MPDPTALDEWSDVLAATHLRFDVSSTSHTPEDFSAAVTRRRFGGLALVDCASSPWLGHRDDDLVGDQTTPVVGFQVLRKGVEAVRAPGQGPIELHPGDMIIWNGWQPVEVEVVEPFQKRTLLFPRDRVLAVCPRFEEIEDLPPLRDSAPARLLVRYLNALALELPELDTPAGVAAADAALELLRAAVEPGVPTSRESRRAALRAEIRRYVHSHLRDPALGPESIARAHAISVRALHAVFEDCDESVAGLVRHERLTRCMEDLQAPSGGSVTEIAFRWGFRDAAHFSRVFKREFGVSPSDVRGSAVTAVA
ncbi:helix-turn-helix domain-containing protein [Capillimicrobium parvum]|uniref:helix-turn-helix domain-containing protein n=1 Tax=Capillimicrobium parvum TaxID=2884022 RepID=UPI00216ADCC6|nr:helix-turn-helix domain-containing protein [Capillimicrobium parvum]